MWLLHHLKSSFLSGFPLVVIPAATPFLRSQAPRSSSPGVHSEVRFQQVQAGRLSKQSHRKERRSASLLKSCRHTLKPLSPPPPASLRLCLSAFSDANVCAATSYNFHKCSTRTGQKNPRAASNYLGVRVRVVSLSGLIRCVRAYVRISPAKN